MEVKSGYKQTEVGVIPQDWKVSQLGPFCSVITKGTTPTSIGMNFARSGIRFLKAESISETGHTIPDKVAFIDDVTHSLLKRSQLVSGDLVVSIAGVLGRVGLVNDADLPANTNQALAIVRLGKHSGLDRMFLFYSLRSPVIERQIRDINVQAAQANISLQNVSDFRLPHPPTEKEQRALESALNDADELLSVLDRLIAKKRDLKQAAMQQLLTGHTRLPGFKDGWQEAPLEELFDFSGGYSASRDQLTPSDGYCYLHYGDIHGRSQPFIDARLEFSRIPKLPIALRSVNPASLLTDGDVVFVDASEDDDGTSKHVVIRNPSGVPFISGLHTIVAKPKTSKLCSEFLCYCFQSAHIKNQFRLLSVGTKVKGINKTTIKLIRLKFPSKEEQEKIGRVLVDMDVELDALTQRREKTRTLKQGMMQQLLTGKVRLV